MSPATEIINFDFSETQKLQSDGMLLFVAEVSRLIKFKKNSIKFNVELPVNDKVCQVFEQIGLTKLLNFKTNATPQDADVVNWRYAFGQKAEGKKYDDILAEFDGEIAPPLQEQLYTGITEAMTNVTNHAYELSRNDGCNVTNTALWWMFSQYKDGELSVTFCDLGSGIPRTLPMKRPSVWRRVVNFGRKKDSKAIEYSIQDSISRTQLDHRGKGLGQIAKLAMEFNGAEVFIASNRGLLWKTKRDTKRKDYKDSIMGTIINWRIPLKAQDTP